MDMSIYDKATNPYHRSGLEGAEVLLPAVGTLTQCAAPFCFAAETENNDDAASLLLLVASGLRHVRKMLDYMQPGSVTSTCTYST